MGTCNSSPVRYPLLHYLETYILSGSGRCDTFHFSALSSYGAALIVPFSSGTRDTAYGAMQKQRKHLGPGNVLELSVASEELCSLFRSLSCIGLLSAPDGILRHRGA